MRNWKLKDQWSVECRQNEISNVERECALYRSYIVTGSYLAHFKEVAWLPFL